MHKIKSWVKRYGPAEIVGTIAALISATVVYLITKNEIITAVAGTWGENIGFYSVIIARDIHASKHHHKTNKLEYTVISVLKDIRAIVLEFGPAEIFDTFLSRPFMMYLFQRITGNLETGIFMGKIAADISMYIPVIISYELHQIYKNKK